MAQAQRIFAHHVPPLFGLVFAAARTRAAAGYLHRPSAPIYEINASPETGPNHHPITLHTSIVV